LELTSYRPFELDRDDCMFIGAVARRGFDHLSADNRALQIRQVSGTAARLAASGRFSDALKLLPTSLYPAFLARYLLRAALPDIVRRVLRRGGSEITSIK